MDILMVAVGPEERDGPDLSNLGSCPTDHSEINLKPERHFEMCYISMTPVLPSWFVTGILDQRPTTG